MAVVDTYHNHPIPLMLLFGTFLSVLTSVAAHEDGGTRQCAPPVVAASTPARAHPVYQIFSGHSATKSYEIKSYLSADFLSHEQSTQLFAIMIDAGSTGTRLHLFEFSHDLQNPSAPFKLQKESFFHTSPGLSSYVCNMEKVGESVHGLLAHAKTAIPPHMWKDTPLALKATAGLRLLPHDTAEAILTQVEIAFDTSPFLVNDDSVNLMSGIDEGIFGWFTLNFLLGRLYGVNQGRTEVDVALEHNLTAAALDLGGGSTQVTFRPLDKQTTTSDADLRVVKVFGEDVEIFTKRLVCGIEKLIVKNPLHDDRFMVFDEQLSKGNGLSVTKLELGCYECASYCPTYTSFRKTICEHLIAVSFQQNDIFEDRENK